MYWFCNTYTPKNNRLTAAFGCITHKMWTHTKTPQLITTTRKTITEETESSMAEIEVLSLLGLSVVRPNPQRLK